MKGKNKTLYIALSPSWKDFSSFFVLNILMQLNNWFLLKKGGGVKKSDLPINTLWSCCHYINGA